MRARALMTAAAVAVLLAVAPAAGAQTATPTLTPTATPAQANPTATPFPADSARGKAVQRVYDDYRRDGVIEPCRHTQQALQDTLDTIQPSFDQDYPDFRAALGAGIQRHERGRCDDTSGSATATPTATATATATATVTAAPTTAPSSTPESGLLPGGGGGSGSGDDGGDGSSSGAIPGASVTPSATASPFATPTPTAPAPQTVVEPAANATALTLPRVLLAIALIGGALLGLSALLASRGGRLAGMRHAWREAGLRTRATWSDFADWLRLGR